MNVIDIDDISFIVVCYHEEFSDGILNAMKNRNVSTINLSNYFNTNIEDN
jgi:hypothetical protein